MGSLNSGSFLIADLTNRDIRYDSYSKSYSVNNLTQFRENWGIIHEVYDSDPRSLYTGEKFVKFIKEKLGVKDDE